VILKDGKQLFSRISPWAYFRVYTVLHFLRIFKNYLQKIIKSKRLRKRTEIELTKQEMDEEYFLKKEWKKYIHQQHNFQMDQIQRALKSQEYALQELKCDSLIFYNKAIQVLKLKKLLKIFHIRVMPKQNTFLF
jgi:hypothetical protein